MRPWKNGASLLATVLVSGLGFTARVQAASDVVTVATVTASSSSVTVPVYIRDVGGTSLGMDRPAGSKIQSLSIKVSYSPASSVQSVSFSRAGITASLTPAFESKPTSSNSVSLLATFQESSDLIPFTLNASAPGNQVARLSVVLSPSATPGSTITLTLDPALTQLTDAGGTAATKETTANGGLSLVNGQITVPPLSVSLSPGSRTITAGDKERLTATLSSAAATSTTISLSSNNTVVATVPSSVVIPAGSTSASFDVAGLTIGSARITATLGASSATSNISVVADTPTCPKPAPPSLSAPTSAAVGTSYAVSWNAVSNASEYELEESQNADFSSPVPQTLNTTSATFTHTTGGERFFYRLRARNKAATCDVFSNYSSTVSVLITAAPAPLTRVLAVVGSLPGNFGSFFRTSLQLYNQNPDSISGTIVFHPAGVSGAAATDTSLPYTIGAGKTLAFADILPAMGLASGLGSLDLIATGTSPLPVALARVFNDGGPAGTTGLMQEALSPDDALIAGSTGVLLAPADAQNFRLNIGTRTMEQGATITITARDKDGLVVKTRTREYPPTFFEQVSSASLLEGFVLTGGETLSFEVTHGSAFVYGSTTDNKTNDPSVQFARRVE